MQSEAGEIAVRETGDPVVGQVEEAQPLQIIQRCRIVVQIIAIQIQQRQRRRQRVEGPFVNVDQPVGGQIEPMDVGAAESGIRKSSDPVEVEVQSPDVETAVEHGSPGQWADQVLAQVQLFQSQFRSRLRPDRVDRKLMDEIAAQVQPAQLAELFDEFAGEADDAVVGGADCVELAWQSIGRKIN